MRPSRYRSILVTEQQATSIKRVTQAPKETIDTQDQIDEDALDEIRTHTSVVRQNLYRPAKTYEQATRRVNVYVHDQPRQQSQRQPPLLLPVGVSRPFHLSRWPAYVGLAGVLMVGGWLGIGMGQQAWQGWQNDLHYGRPRTYQIDAVVGHNHDMSAAPSHFIALNLRGQITVIELPAGDPSKAHDYATGVSFMGGTQDLVPVTLEFKDLDGDGKPDMIVIVGDRRIAYKNENDMFSSKPMKEGEQ